MKSVIAFLLGIFISASSLADQRAWSPKASFQLENSDLEKTMLFVSGMGYGLTEYTNELVKKKKPRLFCVPGRGLVTSPMIFDILNRRHSGEKITAEQAVATVMSELQGLYPCK
jgi:hypothetical protein